MAYGKTLIVDRTIQWSTVAAMALGIVAALSFKVDLFEIAGVVTTVSYLGEVLTGILISRGSDYIVSFLETLDNTTIPTR